MNPSSSYPSDVRQEYSGVLLWSVKEYNVKHVFHYYEIWSESGHEVINQRCSVKWDWATESARWSEVGLTSEVVMYGKLRHGQWGSMVWPKCETEGGVTLDWAI